MYGEKEHTKSNQIRIWLNISKERSRLRIYLIIFEDGARTKLRYYEFEQVSIATEGKGIVVLQTGVNQTGDNIGVINLDEIHFLNEGDFVYISPF